MADRDVDGKLAALHELYTLCLACLRNRGARTCHVFDPRFARLVAERARHEGFEVRTGVPGDAPGAVSVERPDHRSTR